MFNEIHIKCYAVVVDALVEMIVLPLGIGYWESRKPLLNGHLGFNVTLVVSLEIFPFIKGVTRIITGATAVCDSRFTRFTKITNKVLAGCQLLLLKTENESYLFKGKRQTESSRPHHRAKPRVRVNILTDGVT